MIGAFSVARILVSFTVYRSLLNSNFDSIHTALLVQCRYVFFYIYIYIIDISVIFRFEIVMR